MRERKRLYPINLICHIVLFLFTTIEGFANVQLSLFEGRAIDILAYGAEEMQNIHRILISLILFLVMQWVFSVVTPYLFKLVYIKNTVELRNHILRGILEKSIEDAEKLNGGDLNSRLSSDLNLVEKFYSNDSYIFLRRLLIATFALILAMNVNWFLALMEFSILPLIVYVNVKIDSKLDEKYYLIDEYQGQMSDVLYGSVNGTRIIKAYSAQKYFCNRFKKILEKIYYESKSNNKTVTKSAIQLTMINFAPTLIHLTVGAYFVYCKQISFGEFILFGMLRGYVSGFLMFLPKYIPLRHEVYASERRLYEIIDSSLKRDLTFGILPPDSTDIVCVENVRYAYQGNDVLCNINAKIKQGCITVLNGPSGSGKTSLLNIIIGFYKPLDGSVRYHTSCLLDGRPNIAYVGQKPFIFSASVIDNIKIGNEQATEAEIVEVCKALDIYDAIMNLPLKFETMIGADSAISLSGGQLQRICIARACVSSAPIVVMDEPTSSVDFQNEISALKLFQSMRGKKTFLVVSHSETMSNEADYVLSLSNGVLEERKR